MLQSLNFKHIFYFWAVAKQASVSKAAILLNVSQSSISEQLKTLEGRVGIDLFDRTQRKMVLTSNGATLFQKLDEFFPVIEELFESLAHHKTADVKFLRVGLCPSLSQNLRHDLCFPFIEDPNYTVKALQGENEFLLEAFNRDEVDLIFTTNDHMNPNGKCEKHIIARKRFCIMASNNLYDKLPKTRKLEALNNFKFINYTPDSDLHFKSYNFMHKHDLHPVRIAEIDDINLIKNTMMDMDCFSILPINSVKEEIKNQTLKQVGPIIKELESKITAIYKPSFHSDRFSGHLSNISAKIGAYS